jgi:hypothetical protein
MPSGGRASAGHARASRARGLALVVDRGDLIRGRRALGVIAGPQCLHLARGAGDLAAEAAELILKAAVRGAARLVEGLPCARHAGDERHSEGPRRPHDERHRVDALKALRPAGGRYEPDDPIREQGGSRSASLEPVDRVLERPGDRALVEGARPDHGVRTDGRLGQASSALGRVLLSLGTLEREVELRNLEQLCLRPRPPAAPARATRSAARLLDLGRSDAPRPTTRTGGWPEPSARFRGSLRR